MLPANTLLSLACLIANKGPMDTSALDAQLSAAEVAQVKEISASGACLPENMEALLQSTEQAQNSGSMVVASKAGPPSDACY
jgi:hypothetical protein